LCGQRIATSSLIGEVAVFDEDDRLLALAEIRDGVLHAHTVFRSEPEV
jgi:hypothetical protein